MLCKIPIGIPDTYKHITFVANNLIRASRSLYNGTDYPQCGQTVSKKFAQSLDSKLRPKINKLQKIAQNIVRQQIKAIKDVAQGFEKSPKWQMFASFGHTLCNGCYEIKVNKTFLKVHVLRFYLLVQIECVRMRYKRRFRITLSHLHYSLF